MVLSIYIDSREQNFASRTPNFEVNLTKGDSKFLTFMERGFKLSLAVGQSCPAPFFWLYLWYTRTHIYAKKMLVIMV